MHLDAGPCKPTWVGACDENAASEPIAVGGKVHSAIAAITWRPYPCVQRRKTQKPNAAAAPAPATA